MAIKDEAAIPGGIAACTIVRMSGAGPSRRRLHRQRLDRRL